jgi:hypothetical protein
MTGARSEAMTIQDPIELAKRLAELEEENARLKAGLRLKVGKAGGVSVYGLQKWPITLYRGQWEKLLDMKDEILAFIKANRDKLAVKD